VIRLYPDNSQPAAAGKTIRLYSDTPPAAPKGAPSSTVPKASTATGAKTPIPAGAPTSTDAYFRGKGYGASNVTDVSGRPLLTFKNETKKQSQLLDNRVATKWDPTVPKKLDRKDLVNGRVPVEVTNAIREELGAGYDDELDHRIALSLGGSNQKSNLGLEPGRTTKGRAQELNKLVNQISKQVSNGTISHLEGQRRIAEAKGVTLPDIGAKPYESPVRASVAPKPTAAPNPTKPTPLVRAPLTPPQDFRTQQDFRSRPALPRDASTVPAPVRKAANTIKGAATDAAAGFFASPEEQRNDPRNKDIGGSFPYILAAGLGSLGPLDDLAKAPKAVKNLRKGAEEAVNLARLNIAPETKQVIEKTAEEIAPLLSKVKGARLSNAEVIEAAASSDILRKGTTREATLKSEAALLRTRQHLAAAAQNGKITPDFIDNLRVVSAEATRRGRELQALSIGADPSLNTIQTKLVRQLVEMGKSTDEIIKAAEGVDFTSAKQVTAFYRKFVKPTLPELVDEYRYINLLSSPKTHITNAFSNILQSTILRPATRLVSGAIDTFASKLAGKEQEYFVKQVPAYYRGIANGFSEATSKALKALKGESFIERPDLARIPTGSKALAPGQIVPRALEASDAFFRTLAEFGEREALAVKYKKAGKTINEAEIAEEATRNAMELVFRKPLDATNESGHGTLLSRVDQLTSVIYNLRKVPGVKWFVPFVETPMNILKQGIEYSPLGVATLSGNTRKLEQVSKMIVGSTVMAGAGALALDGRTTWSLPTNTKDRAAFYEAGLQPYSVKIGDTCVSYSKLGPLAYPIAMAAAMRYYAKDDPKAAVDPNSAVAKNLLRGIAEFFSDQSYVQGLGDLLDVGRGDQTALNRIATNVPSQLVPLASLQRWITQIIDPVYRKAPADVSVPAIIENLKKGIPGLSFSVEPYRTNSGEPSRRQMPMLNAATPLPITKETPAIDAYEKRMQAARDRAIKRAKEDAN
jgi:Asp-tRNA(Asn)/Glu-tRNA(Gln) amidotransferase C subunit